MRRKPSSSQSHHLNSFPKATKSDEEVNDKLGSVSMHEHDPIDKTLLEKSQTSNATSSQFGSKLPYAAITDPSSHSGKGISCCGDIFWGSHAVVVGGVNNAKGEQSEQRIRGNCFPLNDVMVHLLVKVFLTNATGSPWGPRHFYNRLCFRWWWTWIQLSEQSPWVVLITLEIKRVPKANRLQGYWLLYWHPWRVIVLQNVWSLEDLSRDKAVDKCYCFNSVPESIKENILILISKGHFFFSTLV